MRVVATGYASVDTVMLVAGQLEADRTTIVRQRFAARRGGAVAYLAESLARGGLAVEVVSWVGADRPGEAYVEGLTQARVGTAGIIRAAQGRTPISILAYDETGGCTGLYDPGAGRVGGLSRVQKDLVAAAEFVCVTVGPSGALRDVLDVMAPKARLAWAVRADNEAFPHAILQRLAERADMVAVSARDRPFIAGALAAHPKPARILFETRGARGVQVEAGARPTLLTAPPVSALDVTGAAETFFGAALVALLRGQPPEAAAQAGIDASSRLMDERARAEA